MVNARTVFRTEWFDVEEEWFDDVPSLRGRPHYRINSPDGVIVLAMTDAGEMVLVRQFRPALRRRTLELPSGAIDHGETPLAAARRELVEEAGYVCRDLVDVGGGRMMMNRHVCREFAFVGTGATRDPGFQPKEDIDVVLVRPPEFRAMVADGRFEQMSALALLVRAEWTCGLRVVPAGDPR